MSEFSVFAAMPFILLLSVGFGMLCWDLFFKCDRLVWLLAAVFGAWGFAIPQYFVSETTLNGLVFLDAYTLFFYTLILFGTAATFMLNHRYLEKQSVRTSSDIDMLILLAACGAMVMVSAANLIVLFIGFELLSVCVYVLCGTAKKERASSEGALKYFLFGAFSSAFLLYGMAMIYGACGSLSIPEIAQSATTSSPMLLMGIGLLVFGFGFKVSLVPFHIWTPDVYQGAPVSITGFMAVVVKVAAFGSFLRVMSVCFGGIQADWAALLWTIAVITMTIGNIVALRQSSIKRMLAYSSIAHAGYALIGFIAMGSSGGVEATLYYMLSYSLMTVASFGAVIVVTSGSDAQYENDSIESMQGLGWTHPFVALVLTISLFSLAGIPPLAGFVGKFYLFKSAVTAGYTGLAIIAALNSVVSLYYYLRVVVVLYFKGDRELSWTPNRSIGVAPTIALATATAGTLAFGLLAEYCYPFIVVAVQGFSS
jgi:NADH-quinone oxidoreductase subunit N